MLVGDNRKNSWVSHCILYKNSCKFNTLLFRVLEHELILIEYLLFIFYHLTQQKRPRFVSVPIVRFVLGVSSFPSANDSVQDKFVYNVLMSPEIRNENVKDFVSIYVQPPPVVRI